MEGLSQEKIPEGIAGDAFNACLQHIQTNASFLSTCSSDDPVMLEATSAIERLLQQDIDALVRLKLTIYLASLREDNDLARSVDAAISDWLESQPNEQRKAWIVSSALHQTNRIDEAIDWIRKAVANDPTNPQFVVLHLNLANYLIESSLHRANIEKERGEISRILEYVEPLCGLPDSPAKEAFESTKAAYLIVLGDEAQLNIGLSLAYDVLKIVPKVAVGYCELYIAYGWQRKLQVSSATREGRGGVS
jgi:tetratricopeptide (TPR) repeat protein